MVEAQYSLALLKAHLSPSVTPAYTCSHLVTLGHTWSHLVIVEAQSSLALLNTHLRVF